jgi:hypothetical protein
VAVTNGQRALWTFLIYALLAPFLAGLTIAFFLGLVSAFGFAHLLPEEVPQLGPAAVTTFVWAIVPAVLTALALAATAWHRGGFHWIVAAAAGVIAFAVASLIFPIGLEDARPYLAFLAGVIAIVVREILVRAAVLAD